GAPSGMACEQALDAIGGEIVHRSSKAVSTARGRGVRLVVPGRGLEPRRPAWLPVRRCRRAALVARNLQGSERRLFVVGERSRSGLRPDVLLRRRDLAGDAALLRGGHLVLVVIGAEELRG